MSVKYRNKIPSYPTNKISPKKRVWHYTVAKKYCQLFDSALKRHIEFSLELNDVNKLLLQKRCYYTNVLFEENTRNHRTIDRIDSNKGYILGNVVACTHSANQIKNFLFEDDMSLLSVTVDQMKMMLSKL